MTDLETLRPEVREAVVGADKAFNHTGLFAEPYWQIIRAELLRLAEIEKERWSVVATRNAAIERTEKAESELAEARETITRLNRRVQVAEAGVAEKMKASAPGSLGRALANAAASKAEAELAALKARIVESAHVDVTLGCAIDGEIPPDLALCKVALVKMEE